MSDTAKSTSSIIPTRDFGCNVENSCLPPRLPIVGLGCSSFSTFFWTAEEASTETNIDTAWKPTTLDRNHPRVQEWIRTIHVAITEYRLTLLDTAPWYGHGTSEVVIGWAMETLKFPRDDLTINTKVGRYEAEPTKQFDFSKETTIASVQRSLERMKCNYINVVQLHDPEFAPSIEQLMTETIPALLECRSKGWCKALGMTGYPLEVQYQLLQRTLQDFGDTKVWDQALTYGHFNLHNSSLVNRPITSDKSFASYCEQSLRIGLLAAAPLSMGLLTNSSPPDWHPASPALLDSCRKAAAICTKMDVNISELALLYALSNPKIPCTILGCKNVEEVRFVARIANRLQDVDNNMPHDAILRAVCTDKEYSAYSLLMDKDGPFASVWLDGNFRWDGSEIAREFWRDSDATNVPDWQMKSV